MVHVFIIGSKGIPANYGGFETFVENLTARKRNTEIQYHVSCMNNEKGSFIHNNAECFNVELPAKGAVGRLLHVSRALDIVWKWRRDNMEEKCIVYILGCRIGPLLIYHAKRLKRLGVAICCNPDGLEWKRDKWNAIEKRILKFCEACLVKCSDLVICDSKCIQEYIHGKYGIREERSVYLGYGAQYQRITDNSKLKQWYTYNHIVEGEYYLIVGRFVPENNYETMITEFMKSHSKKSLVIISNIEKNKFYNRLTQKTGFLKDKRVKFVGTVYDTELLQQIREGAYGYVHGHEVGGTNPSLLEALISTKLNLLIDVPFNKEVAQDSALYWTKQQNSLAALFDAVEGYNQSQIEELGRRSSKRIQEAYDWDDIVMQYEKVWQDNECK